MSEEVSAAYVVMDVEAMYPKLDRTYNWSATENRMTVRNTLLTLG